MTNQVPFFETFWFLLSLFKTLGIFPCKKVTLENGQVNLEPRSFLSQWLSFLISNCIFAIGVSTCFYFVLQRNDLTLFDLTNGFGKAKSVAEILDVYIVIINVVLSLSVGIFMFIELYLKKNEICDFYQFVLMNYRHNQSARNYIKKKALYSLFLMIFVNIAFLNSFAYAIAERLQQNLNLDSLDTFLVVIAVLLFWGNFYVSQFTFYCTFGECILILSNWMFALKENVKENEHDSLQNAQELSKALRMVSKLFSRCNFYGMLIWLVNLILISYRITSTFINTNGFRIEDRYFSIAYFFMAWQHVFFVYNLNMASQKMSGFVQDLKMTIKHTNLHDRTIAWNDKFESLSIVKAKVLENLEEFKGFDAEGYFILGKSFLSSIVTNFLTYLIILIQLKLTLITSFE